MVQVEWSGHNIHGVWYSQGLIYYYCFYNLHLQCHLSPYPKRLSFEKLYPSQNCLQLLVPEINAEAILFFLIPALQKLDPCFSENSVSTVSK